MEEIKRQLEDAGFEYAVAIATKAEIESGVACGQLSIITEETKDFSQVAPSDAVEGRRLNQLSGQSA